MPSICMPTRLDKYHPSVTKWILQSDRKTGIAQPEGGVNHQRGRRRYAVE